MVRPRYALIARGKGTGWVVASRFPDLESCNEAKSSLTEVEAVCVPLTDPRVQAYYDVVNRVRRRLRLRSIRPDELIKWPPRESLW